MADYLKMAETGKGVFNFNNTKFVDDLYEEVKQGDLFTINFTRDLMHFYNYIEKRPDKAESMYIHLKESNSYYYISSAETVQEEYENVVFRKPQNKREAEDRLTHKKLENEDSIKSTSEKTVLERSQAKTQEDIIELKKLMKTVADFERNIPDKDIIQTIK